jgi:hypothetical protein
MPDSVSRLVAQPQQFGRLWWLPPGGISNGLSDDSWAPILEIDSDLVDPLLAALGARGVPAYAAATLEHRSGHRLAALPGPRAHAKRGPSHRVWVGCSAYGRAEETLITVLPALVRRRGSA